MAILCLVVGFISGDAVAWARWWFPAHIQPALDSDGILPDPSDQLLRRIYPDASPLAGHAERRVVIMLADPGMGKSFELSHEIERLRSLGTFVERIDLGEYLSSSEVSNAVRRAVESSQAADASGLTLALDGFDEPLFSVTNLGDVLGRELKSLDQSSTRLMITCRSSLWPGSLTSALSRWSGGDIVTLKLAPLTLAQIRQAAATDVEDVDAFVSAARKASAGPLAARPITLRLLLSVSQSTELPRGRIDLYRLGIEALVQESGNRRLERRRSGPALDRLLPAARRLAAVTLLTGQPRLARLRTPLPVSGQVPLDTIANKDVTPADLDGVFDSALLTGGSDDRTWIHRSVEEYLCAEQLRTMPSKAALALLADPGDPSRVLPQLTEVAAWLAATDGDWFEWMLAHEPESLVNGDLPGRDNEQRRRVGQALLSRLRGGDVPDTRLAYHGLAYDGLEEDLRPVLAPTQPAAIRREAILIAAATDLRELDRPIFDLVVTAVQGRGPADYDDDVQVACYAAHALKGSPDQVLVTSLKEMAADAGLPRQLRMALLESLWPTAMSTGDLVAAVIGSDRRPNVPGFGRRIFRLFEKAIGAGAVQPRELLPWFTDAASHHDQPYDRLAGKAVLDAVFSCVPREPCWDLAVATTIRRTQTVWGFFEWLPADVDGIGADRRREFARDVLIGRRDERAVAGLVEAGLIRTDDLEWWLIELAQGLAGDTSASLSAKVVLDRLVWGIDDQEAQSARASALTLAVPSALVEELFGDAAITSRKAQTEAAAQGAQRREAERASHMFSIERLDTVLEAGDFPEAVCELERQPDGRHRGWQPVAAWPALEDETRQRVAAVAAQYLRRGDLDAAEYDTSSAIIHAYSILTLTDKEALDDVPPRQWLDWLPHLLETPAGHEAFLYARQRSASADPGRTDEVLIAQLRRDVSIGNGWRIHHLGGIESRALSRVALGLAQASDVDPRSLASLLDLAATAFPAEASDTALMHLREYRATRGAGAGASPGLDDKTQMQERAVEAAALLARMPVLQTAFGEVFTALKADHRFARAVIAKISGDLPAIGQALSPDQLAAIYLWARDAFPPISKAQPGVVYQTNPIEEFPNEVLTRLANTPDPAGVQALDDIAQATGDVWLRRAARLVRANARASAWQPPNSTDILAALDQPETRIAHTPEQLGQIILEELDDLIENIQHDRAFKALFWHRQRRQGNWVGYAPLEEVELSDRLARELERRLRHRVKMLRETEVQPKLARAAADQPDLLAIVPASECGSATLIIEIKCNYNAGVFTAIEAQLGDRYLRGPHGSTGIYLVGYYDGEAWISDDPRRRLAKRDYAHVTSELDRRSQLLADRGINAHVRVLDLSLDSDSPEGEGQLSSEPPNRL